MVEFPSLKITFVYPVFTKKLDERQNLNVQPNKNVNTYLGRNVFRSQLLHGDR